MTIHDLIKLSIKKLERSKSTSPSLDGEVLLSHLLNKPKEYLLINPQKKVDPKTEKKFLTAINRRILGWPVAYLIKEKEFYNLKFYVDKNVLIPRPETEGLVDLAIQALGNKKRLKILDVGTGSGCIIISLAKNLAKQGNQYFASDLSARAIAVAKKNAKMHKSKISFGDGSLLEPWGGEKFDAIVANLPYLDRRTDESTKFEPTGALIAAKKGLAMYEQLLKQIKNKITPPTPSYIRGGGRRPEGLDPQFIFLEIGHDQGSLIKKLVKAIFPASPAGGPAYETKIFKDLFSRPRYAVLVRPGSTELRRERKSA